MILTDIALGSIREVGASLNIETGTLEIHRRHPCWIIGLVTHEQLHLSVYQLEGKEACLQLDNISMLWSDLMEYWLGVNEVWHEGYYRVNMTPKPQQIRLDKWLQPNESHRSIVRLSNLKRQIQDRTKKESER